MEPLKHECGVAMVRLLKPLSFYQQKYGTWQYGLNKLYLLMEKQHNRGQEGAGLACVKMQAEAGEEFIFRERALGSGAITEIFANVQKQLAEFDSAMLRDADYAARYVPYAGEMYMGHLRYSTTGKSGISYVHPFLRRNNWRARNLVMCGNFNMTNADEVFAHLKSLGQHPRINSDTYVLLEQLGHRLDRESERVYAEAKSEGLTGMAVTQYIEQHINVANILSDCSPLWDGGYVMCGMTGSGECFSMRDPWGIRSAFYFCNDEMMVLASERPVLQTAFNVPIEEVHELLPGQAIFVSKDGDIRLQQILEPHRLQACSFERIYFSRGSDRDIYLERKQLGASLVPRVLESIGNDVENTVFSFIPNTAEVAYYGMTDEVQRLSGKPVRREKVVWKDIKLRTFITESNSRNDLAAHVYDITYGTVRPHIDNLVVIDDSIVRGTTLRESIIRILDRLQPKKIVFVSSSPQIRYPDYYGIDMARFSEFIAFKAAIALLRDRGMQSCIDEVYRLCLRQREAMENGLPKDQYQNYVRMIYEPFTDEEVSAKLAQLLRSPEVTSPVEIVFQTIDGLHEACPNHPGDWYFSGNYPTPGGLRRLNQAFIDYVEESVSQF